MSALIKITDAKLATKVRPFAANASPESSSGLVGPPASLEIELLRREVAGLVQKANEREEAIKRLNEELESAYQDGEARGREAGLKEAEDASAAQLKRLGAGVEQAVQIFFNDMASLEKLSLRLAVQGLEKILGDESNYVDLLVRSIHVQLKKLNANSVLKIVVSDKDFPDAEQLDQFTQRADFRSIKIEALENLEAGQCQIVLMLGELAVGVKPQWERLRAVLETWAEE